MNILNFYRSNIFYDKLNLIKSLKTFSYKDYKLIDLFVKIIYFKLIPSNAMIVTIEKDRKIDFMLPINTIILREHIIIEKFIDDLIKADLVEKVSG